MVFIRKEGQFAEKMRLCFGIVDQSLPHLRKGLRSKEDMEAAAQIIFHSIICSAVVITDMEKILAIRTKKAYECLADPGFLTPVLQSVTDLKPTYFQQADFPDNMKNVLKDAPEYYRPQPADVVEINGQPFYADQVGDTVQTLGLGESTTPGEVDPITETIRDQIF